MTPERQDAIALLGKEPVSVPASGSDAAPNAPGEERANVRADTEGHGIDPNATQSDVIRSPDTSTLAQLERNSAVQPGAQIGRYRIVSRLGAGGMGTVWLAQDSMLDRKIALKLLNTPANASPDRLQRFVREAKAASALNHPNIITIHEIGQSDGMDFIATEYIEGVTLRALLKQGRPATADIVSIVRQVAAALDTAHRADIVHRDIKPENIMVRPDGLVKVLDFGLARVTEQTTEPLSGEAGSPVPYVNLEAVTDPGTLIGTVKYMSPEQARGLRVTQRSDIFSLGIVLYEMVSGMLPFQGESMLDMIVCIASKPHRPLDEVAPGTPEPIARIAAKALRKDPAERYAWAGELAAELAQWESSSTSLVSNESGYSAADAPAIASPGPAPRRRRWLPWAGVAAGLAVAVAAAVFFRPLENSPPSLSDAKIVPLIGLPGTKDHLAFSPDESRIAFAWDGGTNAQVSPRDIYVKIVGTGDPVRLTNTPEDEQFPAWSPDGRHLSFERVTGARRTIFRIPVTGGREEKIGETAQGHSWSPDGKLLAFTRIATSTAPSGVFVQNVETGASRRITTAPTEQADQLPHFSPDGGTIAFIRVLPGITEADLWVVPAQGGSARPVTFDHNRIYGHTWTADNREIVFAAMRATLRSLWRVPVRGGKVVRVPVTGQDPGYPAVSPRGSKLGWTDSLRDSNIWRAEGPGFNGRPYPGTFGPFQIMIQFPREDHSPEFSPDGKHVVFASGRSGGEDLWISDRDGGNSRQLTNTAGPTGTPHWSPDGKWIAFDSHTRGNAEIYVMPAEGGPWRQLTFDPASDNQPAWSHDGHWIYFKSNRSGRQQFYRIPAAGGAPNQITQNGAFEGFEGPDEKLFYFTKGRAQYGIWTVPMTGGPESPVPELKQAGYWRSWGVMKEGIYFIAKENTPKQRVRFFSFATRKIVPIATVDKEPLWWQAGLALSPDGKQLLFSQLDHAVDELMLMENFH